jgi:hypothetical protein
MYLSVALSFLPFIHPSIHPLIYLETKFRAVLTEKEKVPQATSYQDKKTNTQPAGRHQIDTHHDNFPPPTGIIDRMHRLTVNFISQGRHWKFRNFVYSRRQMDELMCITSPHASKSCGFSFLQNFISSSDRWNGWYIQAWNTRKYARALLLAEDVFILKLETTRFKRMSPFYSNAYSEW